MHSTHALTQMTKDFRRLERAGDYKGLKAYLASPQYERLSRALSPDGRMKAGGVLANVAAKLLPPGPLPKKWSMRVRWTAERIQALREAHARYGEDTAVARALGIPWQNAARARRRYIGPSVADATGDRRQGA